MIAAISAEIQHVGSVSSIFELEREKGDEVFIEHRTRGDIAREGMAEEFLKRKEFDALLMLDADQKNPRHLLTYLRADMETHNLDMVCGHYYRRETSTIQSLCFELTGDESYPFLPLLDVPTDGLHEIAVTGLGCVLIHRRVMEAVQASLPNGMNAFSIGTLPTEGQDYANWGSDFRFFVMARRLGFRLWLDARIDSLHATTLWLGHKSARLLMDYGRWADTSQNLWEERMKLHGMNIEAVKQRIRILEARKEGLLRQADEVNIQRQNAKTDEEMQTAFQNAENVSIAVYEMNGRLKEMGAWLEMLEKYPRITTPEQLPTTENTPKQDHSAEGTTPQEIMDVRREMYRANAADIVAQLPNLRGNGRR